MDCYHRYVMRGLCYLSLLEEVGATDKLLETVVVGVFLEMITQLLPLVLQDCGHLFVYLLEQLVNFG